MVRTITRKYLMQLPFWFELDNFNYIVHQSSLLGCNIVALG
jgi:hypothetical protein